MKTNAIGISTFILASPFSDNDLPLLQGVRELGYDLVEIALEDPSILNPKRAKEAADGFGLAISVGGAFGEYRDLSHETKDRRKQGLDYLLECIRFAAEVGAHLVSGPMYSAVGKARMLPEREREAQRTYAADGIRTAAEYAATLGVALAIEPLNRFETDLVNTVQQGVELCNRIDRSNVGLALDTFHMNIEETDLEEAIRTAGDRLFNFQASENTRGAPGSGHLPWSSIFGTLEEIAYRGAIVVESFRTDVVEIARAVSLWRPVATSMDDLARDSIRFIRSELR